jgi:hypothetical protein
VNAHEDDRFRNAATVTVAITFIVAGAARIGTARHRARRIAARLADTTVRGADVVQVHAVIGRSDSASSLPLSFASTNTALDPAGTTGRRWIDPDHERAVRSLAAADAVGRIRATAEANRRLAVGCGNRTVLSRNPSCPCVYCRPAEHLHARTDDPIAHETPSMCLCGRPATDHRYLHDDVRIVVLATDADELHDLAARHNRTIDRELP